MVRGQVWRRKKLGFKLYHYSDSFFFSSAFPSFLYYLFYGTDMVPGHFSFFFLSWGTGLLGRREFVLGGRLFDSLLVLSDGVPVADRLLESRDGRSRKERWSGVCVGRANKIKTKKKGIFQAGSW